MAGKPSGVGINLAEATPDSFTAEELQKQLANIGLGCEYTKPDKLNEYMQQVRESWSGQKALTTSRSHWPAVWVMTTP
jgi:hypothetical protein